MVIEDTGNDIRTKIDEIIEDKSQNSILGYDYEKIFNQKVTRLKKIGISVTRDNKDLPIVYPCFPSALGYMNSKVYLEKCLQDPDRFSIQSNFIVYLLSKNYLHTTPPHKNCIVLYFNNDRLQHAGTLLHNTTNPIDRLVKSRWGDFPATFTHKLKHVSKKYGNIIEYYTPLALDEAEACYLEYIEVTIDQ